MSGTYFTRLQPVLGYEQLAKVLDDALAQAQAGKGKERHAAEGEAFHDQQIVQLCEWMGSTQGDVFQAAKKAIESTRLPAARAEAELLGAINYLAAAVIVLRRQGARDDSGRGPKMGQCHCRTFSSRLDAGGRCQACAERAAG